LLLNHPAWLAIKLISIVQEKRKAMKKNAISE